MTDRQREIDRNFEVLERKLPDLLRDHRNRYALMRKGEIVGIYDTIVDAKTTGDKFFDDGLFSVQKIANEPVDLGYYSHAVHLGQSQ